MNTPNAPVDLLALYAEVQAELEAARIADEEYEDRLVAEHRAELRAYDAMIAAAHKRGEY